MSASYVDLYAGAIDLGFNVQNLLDNRDDVAVQWQPH
ncbi:MAG: hypothetical protein ACI9WC_001021 [Arenicella sp.]|jgi:hypothetical protein